MPTLDDLPTLSPVTTVTGDDLLPIFDPTANGSSKVRRISLNQINGLSATDVTGPAAGPANITTRITLVSSAGNPQLPAASGVMRDVIVMNGTSAAINVTSATTNIYTSATPSGLAAVNTTSVPANTTARYLADGTNWYRTH
jgi:hypothetical protein